ncbi:hypothetical protein C4D60_Mb01t23450 [Musa balbisiana]|uniref:At4g14310 8-bladed propeller domain-containing protein n=1 Tax=Musa balbisiana TaxID=52838 RepID=A0A4S8JPP4_MUSBA|nr:hypothetical protein C4D60_Mb01t23450 [Musa balbisiana]
MSSRLKERGGGGVKILASKSQKFPIDSTPNDKGPAAGRRRTPIATGKENSRTLSGRKVSAARLNPPPKLVEKPAAAAGVRWSTSSLPRGKTLNPSDISGIFNDLRSDRRLPRVSASDRTGRALGRDLEAEAAGRKSFGEIRASAVCRQGKEVLDSNLKKTDERLAAGTRVSGQQNPKPNGFIAMQAAKKAARISDATSQKLVGRTGTSSTSEKRSRKESVTSKPLLAEDADGYQGSTAEHENKALLLVDKPGVICSTESTAVESNKHMLFIVSSSISHVPDQSNLKDRSCVTSDSTTQDGFDKDVAHVSSNKKKDCLVLQSETSRTLSSGVKNGPGDKGCIDSLPKVEAVQKPSAYVTAVEKVNDDLNDARVVNKYPSKLHEKLALLEGKVQKIASEIKRTKEMLDSNNPDDSKLILSDIQSKISGIEKAVGHTIDGAVSQFDTSKIIAVDCQGTEIVVSGQCEETSVPGNSVNGLNHEELEARFFPHHKLLRNRRSSSAAGGYRSNTHGNPDVEGGSLSPVDENPIALEFLASLDLVQGELNKHAPILESEHVAARGLGDERGSSAAQCVSRKMVNEHCKGEIELMATEKLEEFDDQVMKPALILHVDNEDPSVKQLCEIGQKPSTGGWFVSEEAVLLAHDDGSCSYYDIANHEFKAEYKPPAGVSSNLWGDCWLIRAPCTDGCTGKYVVAASAGNALESGFCSWDFYTRDVRAFSLGDAATSSSSQSSSMMVLGPSDTGLRSSSSTIQTVGQQQWWYKPCGPLLICTGNGQKLVSAYDIRDGDLVMKWEVNSPVMGMEYSSPLQWRGRGKVIVAGTEAISLWDVNSVNPQPLSSVACAGKKVYSLHVNNTDAELGGGVRQRVSSSEVEGNDGAFCMQESINVLDFRLPAGVGLRISRHGGIGHSIYSRGDSIYIGSTEGRLPIKGSPRSRVQHYSLRKGKLVTTYELPELNTRCHHSYFTQVWGSTDTVMGICEMGLFVFDASQDVRSQALCFDGSNTIGVKETIGPDDLYRPTFDYSGSRVLVISRDRPASWRYLL